MFRVRIYLASWKQTPPLNTHLSCMSHPLICEDSVLGVLLNQFWGSSVLGSSSVSSGDPQSALGVLVNFPPWQQPASAAKAVLSSPVTRCLSTVNYGTNTSLKSAARHCLLSYLLLLSYPLPLVFPHPNKLSLALLLEVCLLSDIYTLAGAHQKVPTSPFFLSLQSSSVNFGGPPQPALEGIPLSQFWGFSSASSGGYPPRSVLGSSSVSFGVLLS